MRKAINFFIVRFNDVDYYFYETICLLSKYNYFSAERAGFEPAVPFWSTHTFQACSLNHSDISPMSPNPSTLSEIVAKSTTFFD